MRPIVKTIAYATPSTTSIAALQTLGAAGSLLINGPLSFQAGPVNPAGTLNTYAALSPQGFITLTSANNLSAVNFTITGLDSANNVISEVLAGPNANTVTSVNSYAVVTSITTSAAVTAVSVGTTNGGNTDFLPLDIYNISPYVGIQTVVSGTVTYSMTFTDDDPFNKASTPVENPINASLTSATTSVYFQSTAVMRAVRIKVATGSTGTLRVNIVEQSVM